MHKHKLTLFGGLPGELRLSATVLHEAVGALLEGARLATRFAVDGQSVRKGPRPAWLDAACDFAITGLSAGSAVIALEALPLREVDESRFGVGAQQSFFGGPDDHFGEQTAIDIFGHLLATLVEGELDDIIADRALLDICARFARVSGLHGLHLDGLRGRTSPLQITSNDAPRIEILRDKTPRPQAARVAGLLDTVSASRADVVLTLKDGTRVPGRMGDHDLEALRSLLGKDVVVSGMAHYRPTGRLLLVDVEDLDLARPEDRVFQKVPVAQKHKVVIRPPGPSEPPGVSAFFGTWPGDETDAELLEALRAIG
jgi:hypothetical protein